MGQICELVGCVLLYSIKIMDPSSHGLIMMIAKLSKEKNKVIAKCNCRDKVRCPLEGKCKQECVVYKVEVYSDPNNKRNKKIFGVDARGF